MARTSSSTLPAPFLQAASISCCDGKHPEAGAPTIDRQQRFRYRDDRCFGIQSLCQGDPMRHASSRASDPSVSKRISAYVRVSSSPRAGANNPWKPRYEAWVGAEVLPRYWRAKTNYDEACLCAVRHGIIPTGSCTSATIARSTWVTGAKPRRHSSSRRLQPPAAIA